MSDRNAATMSRQDAPAVEPSGWAEVRPWRKVRRAELIEARIAAGARQRRTWDAAITAQILEGVPNLEELHVGFYWPFKGEYDVRTIARRLHEKGTRLALPVVVEKGRPLEFRPWTPEARLVPGIWNIPVPADGPAVMPNALLVPLVGFDRDGFRLGYGGGYYDRTLAAMPKKPLTIGVGFELNAIATIHPQPHDIPMDAIVTEARFE